jgi:hypothetical protein
VGGILAMAGRTNRRFIVALNQQLVVPALLELDVGTDVTGSAGRRQIQTVNGACRILAGKNTLMGPEGFESGAVSPVTFLASDAIAAVCRVLPMVQMDFIRSERVGKMAIRTATLLSLNLSHDNPQRHPSNDWLSHPILPSFEPT